MLSDTRCGEASPLARLGSLSSRMPLDRFFHAQLPSDSDLLAGREPPSAVGWQTDDLQIWFNITEEPWKDPGLHIHDHSDEVFIVLVGELVIEVSGERLTIGPGEFCCFRKGTPHAIVDVTTPAQTFMIRAPSIDDKRYIDQP